MDDKIIYLRFSDHPTFPHGVTLTGSIHINIRYTAVEDIITEAFQNYAESLDFGNNPPYTATFHNVIKLSIEDQDFLLENEWEDDESFEKSKYLAEQLIETALDWYLDYPTLESIYNYGIKPEVTNFEFGSLYGGTAFESRVMVVKKLVNASDFNTYASEIISCWENKPAYQAFLIDLKAILDSI